jgi:hypothetical protein
MIHTLLSKGASETRFKIESKKRASDLSKAGRLHTSEPFRVYSLQFEAILG